MPETQYHYEASEYCEECLPVDTDHPEVYVDDGEQDTPANCTVCGKPLRYSLTTHGVEYVIEALAQAILDEDYEDFKPRESRVGGKDYYQGSPKWAVMLDWAHDLKWYGGLTTEQEAILNSFLLIFEKADEDFKRRERDVNPTAYLYQYSFVNKDGIPGVHQVKETKQLTDYVAWYHGRKLAKEKEWLWVTQILEVIVSSAVIRPIMELEAKQ